MINSYEKVMMPYNNLRDYIVKTVSWFRNRTRNLYKQNRFTNYIAIDQSRLDSHKHRSIEHRYIKNNGVTNSNCYYIKLWKQ